MLTVEQALERVLTCARPLPTERIPLDDAYGRVLGEDVTSPRDIPPWDNSAMDGFAVRAADVQAAPVTLEVLETIGAGAVPTREVTPGTCSRIMTGAPMPPGADAAIMIEQTSAWGQAPAALEGTVEIRAAASPGQHVRPRGDDVAVGQTVLQAGETLSPAMVGMISSLGFPSVMVRQRPLVAILSTGDEVVEAGWPVQPGQIYSSNTHSLMGLVREAGGIPMHCGIAPDEPEGLRDALRRCLRADLILTTGGVSVGDFDYVKDAFEDVDAQLDFWKVQMKPGKPLAFGEMGGRPTFGLPGNPVSCMVNFLQFVRPVMRTMLGDPRPFLPVVDAILEDPLRKKPGRAHLIRVRLAWRGGQLFARSTGSQSSGVLTSMVLADGFAMLGVETGSLEAGAVVPVQVLRWGWASGAAPEYRWA